MAFNVFVSYKYNDSSVENLPGNNFTEVHDYVDKLQIKLNEGDQIYRGEKQDEDLSDKNDDYIWDHLKNKIFYTSITVVLISPEMKESHKYDKSQWIPWEIYYALRETKRADKQSHRNAVLGVVLPDVNGNYDYMLEKKNCCTSNCICWHTDKLFTILRKNMFNKKDKNKSNCLVGDNVYSGYPSYINMVRWDTFISNISGNLGIAEKIKDNKDDYDLHLSVNE